MKNNFNDCLTRLLKDEGGYTNDPDDKGGPTNYGITIADVRKYVNKDATAQTVRDLSLDQAKNIYKSKYWDTLSCDDLPSGVDYTCFDYGVNSGVGRPRKALAKFKDKSGVDLINVINDERVAFLEAVIKDKPSQKKFEKGWMNRVARVRAYSITLAQKKDNTTGPVVGTATVVAGGGLSQYFHTHQSAIIIGSILAALLIGIVVHLYKNKG